MFDLVNLQSIRLTQLPDELQSQLLNTSLYKQFGWEMKLPQLSYHNAVLKQSTGNRLIGMVLDARTVFERTTWPAPCSMYASNTCVLLSAGISKAL